MENRNTEISSIGEFGLIDRLTKDFPLRNDSSKKGVGDDAAVLSYGFISMCAMLHCSIFAINPQS